MLAMINADKGMALTPADVTFGVPTLVDGTVDNLSDPTKRNSAVAITTPPDAGVRLTANISYNRLKLSSLFNLTGPQMAYGEETSAHGLIAKINTLLNVQLSAVDVEDLPVAASGEMFAVTLRATAASLVCFDEIELTLVPADEPPVEDLPPPSSDTIPAGVIESLNMTLVAPFTLPDDNLLTNDFYDSPANNGSFYMQESPEFKAALRAYDDNNWIADSDSSRVYNMTDGVYENYSHWNFSVALEAIGKADILGDYDVWLTIHETTNPANLPEQFQLVVDGTGLAFSNAEGKFPVGYQSGNVAITDNWLHQYTGSIDGAPKTIQVGVPTGTFRVAITVIRKSDGGIVINAPITAQVPNMGIDYPWQHYDFGLTLTNAGSGLVDGSNKLLSDGTSSGEHFTLVEGEVVRLGVRPVVDALAPIAPLEDPDAWDRKKNLYVFENMNAEANEWYIDVVVDVGTTALRDSTVEGVANKIRLWLTGIDSPSSSTLLVPWTIRWNGVTWIIKHDQGSVADFSPSWISADGTKFIHRLRMKDYEWRYSAGYKQPSGMISKVGVDLTMLSNANNAYLGTITVKANAYDNAAP